MMAYLPSLWTEPVKLAGNMSKLLQRMDSDLGVATGYGLTDIFEKDGKLHYQLELPGVKKEDITARLEKNTLIIKGEINRDETISDDSYLRMERRYGRFQKCFALPDYVEQRGELKASFQDGVLTISLPVRGSQPSETQDITID